MWLQEALFQWSWWAVSFPWLVHLWSTQCQMLLRLRKCSFGKQIENYKSQQPSKWLQRLMWSDNISIGPWEDRWQRTQTGSTAWIYVISPIPAVFSTSLALAVVVFLSVSLPDLLSRWGENQFVPALHALGAKECGSVYDRLPAWLPRQQKHSGSSIALWCLW